MTSYEDFQLKTYKSRHFLASFTLPCWICSIFPFFWIDEWQHLVTSKHIHHWHLKHLFSCHFKNLWKKRNIIVTFQSDQLTEQPQILKDLNHFDLKCYLNCPIRIKIITDSHIFILFLPRVVTLCLHFTPRYRSW